VRRPLRRRRRATHRRGRGGPGGGAAEATRSRGGVRGCRRRVDRATFGPAKLCTLIVGVGREGQSEEPRLVGPLAEEASGAMATVWACGGEEADDQVWRRRATVPNHREGRSGGSMGAGE
jgi:hypothetical protein